VSSLKLCFITFWCVGLYGLVLLIVLAQSLLCNFLVCRFVLLSLPVMPMTAASGKSRLLSAGFHIETHRRCRVAEEGFHLLGEVITLLTSS
jgi:hypothetical protein